MGFEFIYRNKDTVRDLFLTGIWTCASLIYGSGMSQWFDLNLSYLNVWGQSWLRSTQTLSKSILSIIDKDTDTWLCDTWLCETKKQKQRGKDTVWRSVWWVCAWSMLNIFLSAWTSLVILLWPFTSTRRLWPQNCYLRYWLFFVFPTWHWRSAVSEISKPALTSMPCSKLQISHFFPFWYLIFNWNSQHVSAWLHALYSFYVLG